ncbi:hypothetical protein ABNX05_23635 [Lysinibacillus sp. M3]|uniref:Uncharacterized protein n=1 Tax=Lysinibacillus zambalensis TaxID=3160866 RepID=A0ABV1MYL9_9BACI
MLELNNTEPNCLKKIEKSYKKKYFPLFLITLFLNIYINQSEAAATNVFTVRNQSDSNKCFYCAKAKRQQQMFLLCESEAAATNVFTVRKRSGSNKCFYCAKSKRQRQSAQPERKSTPRYGDSYILLPKIIEYCNWHMAFVL